MNNGWERPRIAQVDPQSVQFECQVAPQTDIKWTLLKVSIGRAQSGLQMAHFGLQDAPRSAQVDFQSIHFRFQVTPQTDIKWTLLKVSIGRAQPPSLLE